MAALRRWTIGLSILASAAAGGRALLAGPPPRPEKARAAVDAAPPRAAVEIPVELARIDIAAEGAEVEIRPDVASIASRWMRIDHSIEDGRFRTSRIDNRAASTSLAVEGEDFVIEIGGRPPVASSALRLVEKPRRESAPGERVRLVADLAGEGLRVRMITELRGGGGWAERWLEIRGEPGTLDRVALARWPCPDARGPAGPGALVGALGLPSGRGQVVYARDLFFAVAHPGAESYARDGRIDCSIADYRPIDAERPLITRPLVIGAGAAGDAWRCFIRYIDETRAVPSRMIFLVNDWYWKDKSRPLEAIRALARVKRESGVPVDSFTLDDGWDFDWDVETLIWGRLHRQRFPGGWDALQAAGAEADIGISLWFGPIGGYSYRPKRIAFAETAGFEIQSGKLCLAGPRYRRHVVESFSRWAREGMDYIKVDGFWPDCQDASHGHPVGPGGTIAQMDALIETFAAWRRARAVLLIGYTSGSNPSPFWLQHADFLWRGGHDDSHAGAGTPFDRHHTYLDSVLQLHRTTDMPASAFVTFDIVQHRIAGGDDAVFERGFWWLAARTSLHHDWYIQASDITLDQWKMLARAAKWAKGHEKLFRFGRMVGGDPSKAEVYGFSAWDGEKGTLALRNPSGEPRSLESSLGELLLLPRADESCALEVKGVHGETGQLAGKRGAGDPIELRLPPLAVAIFEVEASRPPAAASSE